MKNANIFVAIFSCGMAVVSFFLMRTHKLSVKSFLVWIMLWFSMVFFSLYPDALIFFMRLADMENRIYFLFIVTTVVIFIILFSLFVSSREKDKLLHRLTQEIALLNYRLGKIQKGQYLLNESSREPDNSKKVARNEEEKDA